MEEITSEQKQNYELILNEIDEIQNEYDRLKLEAAKVDDLLRAMKILNNPDFAREKIFQVKVKLFDGVNEIFNVYPETILTGTEISAITQRDAVLYHIEIYISQQLHSKLISQNWLLAIEIKNGKKTTNKTMNIKNRVANPISIIIPCENNTIQENSYLSAFIISPNELKWNLLKLAEIKIDVSYKFRQTKRDDDEIIKINKIYNEFAIEKNKMKPLQYKFKCNWTAKKFIETFLINSCHKLDLVKILNKSESIAFKLDSINLDFNPADRIFAIEAGCEELYQLKKYSMQHGLKYCKEDFSGNPNHIKDLKNDVLDELKNKNVNLHALLNIYDKYVKFMANYPL